MANDFRAPPPRFVILISLEDGLKVKKGILSNKFWFQVSAYAAVSERADALAGRDFS